MGLGLSGIKSLDVLRDLPPLHASNSTSTTGSTAAVIIIQPITLSNVLTRLHSSRKFTGVDPQAYLTNVLTKLVNLWPAFDKLMPWAGAAKRCAHKLAAYQHLRPENQAVSTGGSEICLRPSGNIAKIKSASEQLGQWRVQIAARPPPLRRDSVPAPKRRVGPHEYGYRCDQKDRRCIPHISPDSCCHRR